MNIRKKAYYLHITDAAFIVIYLLVDQERCILCVFVSPTWYAMEKLTKSMEILYYYHRAKGSNYKRTIPTVHTLSDTVFLSTVAKNLVKPCCKLY